MSQKKIMNRRDFLRASAMASVATLAAACAQPTPQIVEKEVPVEKVVKETVLVEKEIPVEKIVKETVVVEKEVAVDKVITATPIPAKFNEAPALAELVRAGKLPPVEDRLPAEPMVVQPLDELGKYGGTLRSLYDTVDGAGVFVSMTGMDTPLRWDTYAQAIEPNVFRAWEVSADSKIVTFYLRKGMKWSDGAPATADDVMFYFEDILGNEELSPSYPKDLVSGGEPEVIKVDDYTFQMHYPAPHGFLFDYLAHSGHLMRPKHYLTQFHPAYAPAAALDATVKEAGLESWFQLFPLKDDWYKLTNPDLPVVFSYTPTTEMPATRFVYDRNPYYWKVDPEGNQLPYIDELVISTVESGETLRLQVLAGRSDLQYKRMDFDFFPLLKENETKGGYRVLLWTTTMGTQTALFPNQNSNDPVLGQLIQDKRYRIALSHAINREQINEIVWLGMGVPRQATFVSDSPAFKEEYARAWADYDPAKANALLDELGLTKRDKDGYRLRSDGEMLFMLIETAGEEVSRVAELELVKQYWEAVGVKTEFQPSERSIFRNRVRAGDMSIGTWNFDKAYYPFKLHFVAPLQKNTYWAPQWGDWYNTKGEAGVEPPEVIKELQRITDEIVQSVDREEQIKLFQDALDLHAEHCWVIGLVGEVPQPIVINEKLRNIPEKTLCANLIGRYLGLIKLEQVFFDA
jgi:peptide/nickel transport system substrate-binding protein